MPGGRGQKVVGELGVRQGLAGRLEAGLDVAWSESHWLLLLLAARCPGSLAAPARTVHTIQDLRKEIFRGGCNDLLEMLLRGVHLL